jgi:hypothetical protein
MYGQPARSSEFPPDLRSPTRKARALARVETVRAEALTWLGYFWLLASVTFTVLTMHGLPTQ